jgi:hypothetical protein
VLIISLIDEVAKELNFGNCELVVLADYYIKSTISFGVSIPLPLNIYKYLCGITGLRLAIVCIKQGLSMQKN